MKKLYKLCAILLILNAFMMTGCNDDEETWRDNPPKIAFAVKAQDVQDIDLNETVGPKIKGTVQSDAGLVSVVVEETSTSSSRKIIEVTDFDEVTSKIFVIDILPEYTAEITGLKVTAKDSKGREATESLEFSAVGGLVGPKMTLPTEVISANVRPSVNIRPAITGTIASHWGLESVTLFMLHAGGAEQAGQITDFGADSTSYPLNYIPDYDKGLEINMTGLRILAIDNRGNESSDTVEVSIIDAPPAPEVIFDEESVYADLKVTPSVEPKVTGAITAEEEITAVSYYLIMGNTEEQIGTTETSFPDPHNYDFEIQPTYKFGVSAIKVTVKDAVGQTTNKSIPVTVNADDPNLQVYNNVEIWGAGVRFDNPTAFSFSDGVVYQYDQQPVNDVNIAKSIYFIATATSNGDALYDVMSPVEGWLGNNYYKGVEWAYNNSTQLRLLDIGELDFESATSIDIAALSIGDGGTRARKINEGSRAVLFESEEGVKGVIYLVSTEEDPGSHKNDKMTFNIKVLK